MGTRLIRTTVMLVVSKYWDHSRLKISGKISEQEFIVLPVDVGLLEQLHKMHGLFVGQKLLNQQIWHHM